jgi:hypothetical protein
MADLDAMDGRMSAGKLPVSRSPPGGKRGEDGVVDAQDRCESVLMGQVSLAPPALGSAA